MTHKVLVFAIQAIMLAFALWITWTILAFIISLIPRHVLGVIGISISVASICSLCSCSCNCKH